MISARQCVRRRASGQLPSGDVGLARMVYYFVLNVLVVRITTPAEFQAGYLVSWQGRRKM
jgi:hypothetical protein